MIFLPQPFNSFSASHSILSSTHPNCQILTLPPATIFSFNKETFFNQCTNIQKSTMELRLRFQTQIQQILTKSKQINRMVNSLQKNIMEMEKELNILNQQFETLQQEDLAQTCSVDNFEIMRYQLPAINSNRTHPKIKLMQKIFGKKQYGYKLSFDQKFPRYIYKQRNITLQISLKDKFGVSIFNENQISLNLKVYQSNGEQVYLDGDHSNYMNGLCQTSMCKGVGVFSKIHPKQVSRKFSQKGLCIIIYATSQQMGQKTKGLNIEACQIQPLIFYNIKVIVKQTKNSKKDKKIK